MDMTAIASWPVFLSYITFVPYDARHVGLSLLEFKKGTDYGVD